jgi:uncharacterized CHY-type Zn-finger protein
MNITEDMKNIQYIAQGVTNHALGRREEEYQSRLIICKSCDSIYNLNETIWGPRCNRCGCPIRIRAKSDKGCPRGKW